MRCRIIIIVLTYQVFCATSSADRGLYRRHIEARYTHPCHLKDDGKSTDHEPKHFEHSNNNYYKLHQNENAVNRSGIFRVAVRQRRSLLTSFFKQITMALETYHMKPLLVSGKNDINDFGKHLQEEFRISPKSANAMLMDGVEKDMEKNEGLKNSVNKGMGDNEEIEEYKDTSFEINDIVESKNERLKKISMADQLEVARLKEEAKTLVKLHENATNKQKEIIDRLIFRYPFITPEEEFNLYYRGLNNMINFPLITKIYNRYPDVEQKIHPEIEKIRTVRLDIEKRDEALMEQLGDNIPIEDRKEIKSMMIPVQVVNEVWLGYTRPLDGDERF